MSSAFHITAGDNFSEPSALPQIGFFFLQFPITYSSLLLIPYQQHCPTLDFNNVLKENLMYIRDECHKTD